jgi:hypothetical protein
MRVTLTRSGGFAGTTVRRTIDTSRMPVASRRKIERLIDAARQQPLPHDPSPDSFQYEIEINSERYLVSDSPGPWRVLIETLMASE